MVLIWNAESGRSSIKRPTLMTSTTFTSPVFLLFIACVVLEPSPAIQQQRKSQGK
jgi:hypothetical protein